MFRRFWQRIAGWFGWRFPKPAPEPVPEPQPRRVVFYESDELPAQLPGFDIAVAREGDLYWAAGMHCPCGCGRRIELMLLDDVSPRWRLQVDDDNRVTLKPSVWLKGGCRSHFWVTAGNIRWC